MATAIPLAGPIDLKAIVRVLIRPSALRLVKNLEPKMKTQGFSHVA